MKRLLLFVSIFILAIAIFLVFFVPAAWFSTPSASAPSVSLEVSSGDDAGTIATKLVSDGIVVSPIGYEIYASFNALANRPKLGTYTLQPGMNYRTIANMLAKGPAREEVQLQVIEGWNLSDIADMLAKGGTSSTAFYASAGVPPNGTPFDPAWRTEFPFLAVLPKDATLEGYLFPDTYRVWKDQLPESLIEKQLQDFATRAPDLASQAEAQERTLQDVVTLASIIEKEVAAPADRRIVAGIFLNRLKDGMPLQSDATINYVTNSGRASANAADLSIDSPYNTYKYKGLPPGPICNPSADALDAALHPTQTDYQYFLTGKDGKVYYAKTLDEQDQNKIKAAQGD
ncbi:MAG: endolytic transglycosylase MltG [Patescibacteria group bacterium]